MKSTKTVLLRLVLVGASVFTIVIAGEIVLRILYSIDAAKGGDLKERLARSQHTSPVSKKAGFSLSGLVQASRFDDIVYELKPNLRGEFHDKPVLVNSDGLRGPERAREKPPGTYRIVGLGDSVMFGWGVGETDTFLHLLEDRLNALPGPHPVYEVLNFAVPGYNTAMEVAVFEHKALAYHPDLAIIHFVKNDWGVPKFMKRPPRSLAWNRSYFAEFIGNRLGLLRSDFDESLIGSRLRDIEEDERSDILTKYQYMVGAGAYRAALDRLGKLARENGTAVIILIGSRSPQQELEIRYGAASNGFHVVDIAPVTDRMLLEKGIEPTHENYAKYLHVAPGDPHPGPFGHAIYAQGLMEKLQEIFPDIAAAPGAATTHTAP